MAPTTPDARQQADKQSFGVNCFPAQSEGLPDELL
jgi:hypothetical protein